MKVFCISPFYTPPAPILPTVYVSGDGNPRREATNAATILAERPPEDRCLDVRYPLGKIHLDAPQILARGWPIVAPRAWWREFWQVLNTRLRPAPRTSPVELIACDYEDNEAMSQNITRDGLWGAIYASSLLRNRLPEELRKRENVTVEAWDDYTFSLRSKALRHAICDTFCNVFGVSSAPVGNFDDSVGLRCDNWGRKIFQTSCSNVDMPDCYLRFCGGPTSPLPYDVQGYELSIRYAMSALLPHRKAWPWIETADARCMDGGVPLEVRRNLWLRRTRIMLRLPLAGMLLWRGTGSMPEEDQILAQLIREAA